MTDYLSAAEALLPELDALRRTLHRCPEPGNHEFRTAGIIEAQLHACGIETVRLTDTAVMGTLTGNAAGRIVALRSDMDALPLTEKTGADFASETPGMMHACGHDIHMTALLGAAKLLSARRGSLNGTVRFLFEPDEEGNGGARRMIEAGAMRNVSAVFGAHVAPDLPLGSIGVRSGKFYAASDVFRITVRGKSAHGATPELGIDALAAAAALVLRLKAIPDALLPEPAVVTVGTLQSGTACNILPGEAELGGILRTLGPDSRLKVRSLLREAIDRVQADTGTSITLNLHESYPGVVNSDALSAYLGSCARQVIGDNAVIEIEKPTMTTEDFGYFAQEAPGCFYHIGAGCSIPLHNPEFLPDIRAAVIGAAVHTAAAEQYLSSEAPE